MRLRNMRPYLMIIILVVMSIGSMVGSSEARAGPEQIPIEYSPTPSSPPPSPTPTATPSPTASPTVTPTPTPTTDPVIEISAGYKVERVLLYLPSVLQIKELEGLEVDTILVLAVMAAESGGDYELVSYAGACGPMQVIPKPWYPFSANAICSSTWANLIMGMRILIGAIDMADKRGLDLNYALAFYNCSEESVMNDLCGEKGGLNYAEDVLNFWYPLIRSKLEE